MKNEATMKVESSCEFDQETESYIVKAQFSGYPDGAEYFVAGYVKMVPSDDGEEVFLQEVPIRFLRRNKEMFIGDKVIPILQSNPYIVELFVNVVMIEITALLNPQLTHEEIVKNIPSVDEVMAYYPGATSKYKH